MATRRLWVLGGFGSILLSVAASACSSDDGPTGTPDGGPAESGGAHSAGGAKASGGSHSGGGPAAGGSHAGGAGGNSAGGSSAGGSSAGGASVDGGEDAGADGATPADAGPDGADAGALAAFEPLGDVPPDSTNQYADNAQAAALGQMFFFDAKFSGPLVVTSDLGTAGDVGKVSCASCHSGASLADERSTPDNVSLGANFHTRNAPAVTNSAFYKWTNWAGRFAAQWELPLPVAESPVIMNSNRLKIVHRIYDTYKAEYEAIFGAMPTAIEGYPAAGKPKPVTDPPAPDGAWEALDGADKTIVNRVFVNFGKSLEAYMRQLVSRNSRLDKYVAGDWSALNASEKRGAELFLGKAECVSCHSGPHFEDGAFHNLGVPQQGPHVPLVDNGRFADGRALLLAAINVNSVYSDDVNTGRLAGLTDPMPDSTKGQFRTPSLRNVALSAPYMHSGQLATLEDVVDFYDEGGGPSDVDAGAPAVGTKDAALHPLGLTPDEKADLVAFLKALTGEAIPAGLLTDTSKP